MKLNKKKVLVLALAVCLIATLSIGTLAWFSAEDEIKNDFLFATDDEGKPDFSVDVTEEGDPEDDGLKYEDILPGDVYDKKATVTNTGAYDQYIRVIVEISDGQAWRDALGTDYAFENCFIGFDPAMWLQPIGVNNYIPGVDKIVIVAYYNGILTPDQSITLFEQVKIPEELTVDQADTLAGGFDITVKAHAIQADNVGNNVYAAFNDVVGWKALDEYTNP